MVFIWCLLGGSPSCVIRWWSCGWVNYELSRIPTLFNTYGEIVHTCYNYGRIIMNIENNLFVPFKTLKAARAYVEGFSDPKKMPGWSYGLPTDMCKTGMILKKIPASVCSDCYADKGFYAVYPAVKADNPCIFKPNSMMATILR